MNDIPYNIADTALCIADWFATADIALYRFDGVAGVRSRILQDWAPWLEEGYNTARAQMDPNDECTVFCFDMEFVPNVLEVIRSRNSWNWKADWIEKADLVFFTLSYDMWHKKPSALPAEAAYYIYREPGQVQDLQELFKEIAEKEAAR